jgi:hypothetical protein
MFSRQAAKFAREDEDIIISIKETKDHDNFASLREK